MKSKRMTSGDTFDKHGGKRSGYIFLAGKYEGKRPLGRFSFRWEANIKMDIEEIGFGGVGRIHVE